MAIAPRSAPSSSLSGKLAAIWGVCGVSLFLLQAVQRLAPIALEGVRSIESPVLWLALVLWLLAMGYGEGIRGFHQRFSPRVVARARHLAQRPTALRVLLAPLFCMSLFGASTRGLRVAWGLLLGIALLVAAMRGLAQPWRGIVDAGVVLGLSIGVLSIGYHAARALGGRAPSVDADVID